MKTLVYKKFLGEEMNTFLKRSLYYIDYRVHSSLQTIKGDALVDVGNDFLMGQLPFGPLMEFIFIKIQKKVNKKHLQETLLCQEASAEQETSVYMRLLVLLNHHKL